MFEVERHSVDGNGNPCGGVTRGVGLDIRWQDGPLGIPGRDRRPQNGAFVEDVIMAAIGRLCFFQQSPFACEENATAVNLLHAARQALEARTQRRQAEGTEGLHRLANSTPVGTTDDV